MTPERLAEIERSFGQYLKAKELIAEIRRCWAEIEELKRKAKPALAMMEAARIAQKDWPNG